MLLFNESVDDKRLGQWLKSALENPSTTDPKVEAVKTEILFTYTQAWRLIYSIYDGKCFSQTLAHFYGGVGDTDPLLALLLITSYVQFVSWLKKCARLA